MRIFVKKLVHAILKAKKSHSLLSLSWRDRKAGGIIQDEFKDLEPEVLMSKAGEVGCLSSNKREQIRLPFFQLFLFRPSAD